MIREHSWRGNEPRLVNAIIADRISPVTVGHPHASLHGTAGEPRVVGMSITDVLRPMRMDAIVESD
jgi:hypothetical protein